MKVYNDLLLAADNGDVSVLCLLDLPAAFDTVDHDLMMLKLEHQFGLRGVVLDWFRSSRQSAETSPLSAASRRSL